MSSISSVNGNGSGFSMMSGMKRPDPSKMADNLFSKLDTTNKGYLNKNDLQSALSQVSGSASSTSSNSTSSSTSVDEMFKNLDSNSDDKITKDEMSSGMKKLAEALDSQVNQMRMNGSSGEGQENSGKVKGGTPPSGGRPPPPPSSGSGSTNSASGASSASSTQSNSTTKTYEAADTNQDGKVSVQEKLAYELKAQNSASASSTSSDNNATSSTSSGSDARVMKQIVDLLHAYSSFDSSSNNSGLSVTA